MTKNRALVSGSGKKPWRQKGTGRARARRDAQPALAPRRHRLRPQPRDYSYTMPKKARAAALRAALTQRLREGAVKVVEGFAVEEPKTEVLKGLLAKLGVAGKAVVVDHEPADALVLSGRNLPGREGRRGLPPDRLRRDGLQAPRGHARRRSTSSRSGSRRRAGSRR